MPDYRLAVAYRFQCLRYLDRRPLTPAEKVAAINLCDPPIEIVAAVDHAMHTSKRVFQSITVAAVTSADINRPYPLLVLCGPWGMGKHDLRHRLLQEYSSMFASWWVGARSLVL